MVYDFILRHKRAQTMQCLTIFIFQLNWTGKYTFTDPDLSRGKVWPINFVFLTKFVQDLTRFHRVAPLIVTKTVE